MVFFVLFVLVVCCFFYYFYVYDEILYECVLCVFDCYVVGWCLYFVCVGE